MYINRRQAIYDKNKPANNNYKKIPSGYRVWKQSIFTIFRQYFSNPKLFPFYSMNFKITSHVKCQLNTRSASWDKRVECVFHYNVDSLSSLYWFSFLLYHCFFFFKNRFFKVRSLPVSLTLHALKGSLPSLTLRFILVPAGFRFTWILLYDNPRKNGLF